MGVITGGVIIPGAVGVYPIAGVPSAGTDEVQTITIGGTPTNATTFYLALEGYETAAITFSTTNATLFANVDAALEALPNVGTGGCVVAVGTMTSGVGTMTVTFSGGDRTKQPLSGVMTRRLGTFDGTMTIARTTPGVAADFRGAGAGAIAVDTTNKKVYVNTNTANAPTWTVAGTQT